MMSSDALIIGGGINGLACALRLARAGRRVTVLEAAAAMGGAARATPFAPGLALAHRLTLLDARLAAELPLEYAARNVPTLLLGAGEPLLLDGPFGAGVAQADWQALRTRILGFASALAPFRTMVPPRLRLGGNDWRALLKVALGLRRLGQAELRELFRMALINAADVAEDELEDPRLQAFLAFEAVLGTFAGPRSPGSFMHLLNELSGPGGGAIDLPKGGIPALAGALEAACRNAGVVLRTGARVERILVEQGRATGVALAGEELRAGLVISAIAPETTLRRLLPPGEVDIGLRARAGQIKARGTVAKLHLALSALPDGVDAKARWVIAPGVDAVERAFNPVKYGEVPERPVMEVLIPSAFEPAPAEHLLSALVAFAPHDPADRAAAKALMLDNTLAELERQVPGLRACITRAELLMPWEIEAGWEMPGGEWSHGEMSVEQMLMLRPFAGMARHEGPLGGLWLASAGTHPGGGLSGAPGWNAAERILEAGA